MSNSSNAPVPPELNELVGAARADLAAMLEVAESEIQVVLAETIVWPDSSLGCPQRGEEYLAVPVDGWRAVLVHEEVRYTYHGRGLDPSPFLCLTPTFPPPSE